MSSLSSCPQGKLKILNYCINKTITVLHHCKLALTRAVAILNILPELKAFKHSTECNVFWCGTHKRCIKSVIIQLSIIVVNVFIKGNKSCIVTLVCFVFFSKMLLHFFNDLLKKTFKKKKIHVLSRRLKVVNAKDVKISLLNDLSIVTILNYPDPVK